MNEVKLMNVLESIASSLERIADTLTLMEVNSSQLSDCVTTDPDKSKRIRMEAL